MIVSKKCFSCEKPMDIMCNELKKDEIVYCSEKCHDRKCKIHLKDMAVKKERFYETIEMPRELAELDDNELYSLMKGRSDKFVNSVIHYCVTHSIWGKQRERLIEENAARLSLVKHKDLWIEPMVIIPNRFKRVIDENVEVLEGVKK